MKKIKAYTPHDVEVYENLLQNPDDPVLFAQAVRRDLIETDLLCGMRNVNVPAGFDDFYSMGWSGSEAPAVMWIQEVLVASPLAVDAFVLVFTAEKHTKPVFELPMPTVRASAGRWTPRNQPHAFGWFEVGHRNHSGAAQNVSFGVRYAQMPQLRRVAASLVVRKTALRSLRQNRLIDGNGIRIGSPTAAQVDSLD